MLQLIPKFDLILTLTPLFLLGLGITVLSSVAPELITIQIIASIIGIVIFIFISITNYQIWIQLSKFLYPGIIIFLILPFLFGIASGGAVRWLQIGPISIQPSEITRPFILIILAGILATPMRLTIQKIFKSALLISIPAFIIFKQPDLGLTLTLLIGWFGILLTKGLTLKQILIGAILVALIIPIGWNLILQDYQKDRILTFVNPNSDPLNTGYHVLQSQIAVGSGQLIGRGLGRGTQSHLQFLPEQHTDFIFASMAEELGLAGSLLVLSLYTILFSQFIHILNTVKNKAAQLITGGLLATFLFQVFVNIGMNIGLLPITGVTLPLLSYGGSSIIATFITLGFINNISIQHKQKQTIHIH